MTTQLSSHDAESNLCTECIGGIDFKSWIQKNGRKGKCDFDSAHGKNNKTITVEEFAQEVDRYFRATYCLGEEQRILDDADRSFSKQLGETYKDILANDLECDEPIIEALSEHLPDSDHYEIMQGGESFYDETLNYELLSEVEKREQDEQEERWYEERYSFEWEKFCAAVQFKNRFFKIKEKLDDLFGNPSEYEKGKIRPLYILPKGTKLYRARLLDEEFTREHLIKKDPSKELGAPPKDKTKAGRMNVEFIPAFYAAFCEETAIAEIRPSIGDEVVVGEFLVGNEIKVFDFTAFDRAKGASIKECVSHTRYDFITQLQSEISKPILPFQKQREYIPTQIVAEYLQEYFSCDAVIYRSSMHKNNTEDNRNIVLLNRGRSFVGKKGSALLKYLNYDIHNVKDVTYQTRKQKF